MSCLYLSTVTWKANLTPRYNKDFYFLKSEMKTEEEALSPKGKKVNKPRQQINRDLSREEQRDAELPVISSHHSPKQNEPLSPCSFVAIEIGPEMGQAVLLK